MVIKMPKHEIGIMQISPKKGKRYDHYEPKKYKCISIDDDDILPLLEKFNEVKCYWHTLDRPELGLAYYGITLIPPESIGAIIEIIWNNHNLSELMSLLSAAERYNKYIIHFGI